MAAKNAAKPRPNKNSDGQTKRPQPTMSHDIHISPAKPQEPPPPPGAPAPGAVNPLTHPNAPAMQSSMGSAPPGPTGKPADQRQVQERIMFKDMNPSEQAQVMTQQGVDPYAPLKMVQEGVTGALQQGPSTGAVPNMLAGPYMPPDVQAFPDDMAHLTQLMQQGMAPGSSPQEHELGANAHAMAHAKIQAAFNQAQQGAGAPAAAPPATAPAGPPPTYGPVGFAPGIPETSGAPAPPPGMPPNPMAPPAAPPGPPLGSAMGSAPSAPPMQPGAPGGIPPAMIAALLAKAKGKRPVR